MASITVAVVSAIFAYRNNFGWKPVALTTSIGLSGINDGSKRFKGSIGFEIWNRRKYPIVVRYIKATFEDITIDPSSERREGNWHVTATWANYTEEHTIAPQGHEKHTLQFPFKALSLDRLKAPVTITIYYFDPRANDMRSIQIEKLYAFDSDPEGDVVPMSAPVSSVGKTGSE